MKIVQKLSKRNIWENFPVSANSLKFFGKIEVAWQLTWNRKLRVSKNPLNFIELRKKSKIRNFMVFFLLFKCDFRIWSSFNSTTNWMECFHRNSLKCVGISLKLMQITVSGWLLFLNKMCLFSKNSNIQWKERGAHFVTKKIKKWANFNLLKSRTICFQSKSQWGKEKSGGKMWSARSKDRDYNWLKLLTDLNSNQIK